MEPRISYLEQLRNDIKEEHKLMDKKYKTYDDSWLNIPGYDDVIKSNNNTNNIINNNHTIGNNNINNGSVGDIDSAQPRGASRLSGRLSREYVPLFFLFIFIHFFFTIILFFFFWY